MKTVLVTGTSSGIGRATAITLAGRGWRVYAGVRKTADGEALVSEAGDSVVPVILDVTDEASVTRAVGQIREETGGRLDGLVNNAGVYHGAPLEMMKPEEIRRTLDVNVTGLLEVTRQCLPLLRASEGRIVNISSISGLVALPGVSVYAGSKHAVEAITDSLRVELKGFGIRVAAVEPGSIRTPIWDKGAARDEAREEDPDIQAVRPLYERLVSLLEKLNSRPGVLPPEEVAETVAEALESDSPKNRYIVGKDAKSLALLRKLPDAVRDRLISARLG
ncbi:MAG: SDR family oxidoreductase [Gammaproteobacteria bacterium]